jgi:hypothetical protein
VLGETLTAVQLAAVTQILSNQNLNIDSIKRLTVSFYYRKEEFPRSCIQLSVTGTIIDKSFYDGEFYGNFQNLRCGYFVSGGQYVPKKQTPGVF